MVVSFLKSRTIQFSLLLAVLSVLQGYIGLLPLDSTGQSIVGLIIAACVAVLRVLTTVPLTEK